MVILGSGPDNAHRVVNRTCSTVARMRGWSKCLRIDGAGDGATRDDLQDLQEGLLKRDGCDSNHVVIPQKERRQEAALGAGA
ncbi:hypothetical protein CBR_g19579 [Chara braunii]|uniref:Uncharacterized protein n=1 Tax=Chara braunii TaxID=69332 RepID=A0A388KYC9_CHABU|nr:hypothetical protein CBR_g19579 [Chara braunii]|eukprot:GBG75066.1 hypothetical protein CBR_g19579 [Chara braunii]